MSIQEDGNWKGKIGLLNARNKQAFKKDGGSAWQSNSERKIFKDNFFHVPQKFDWLGTEFKNVKSLVSGIGMEVKSATGVGLNEKMNGIKWSELRKANEIEEKQNNLKREILLERVAYYEDQGNKYKLGKGICAIKGEAGNKDVYLFIGFTGVEEVGGTHQHWKFVEGNFFDESFKCNEVNKYWGKGYRLVKDRIGRKGTLDGMTGQEIILLGHKDRGIERFGRTKDGKTLVGVLMGVAVNIAQGNECNTEFGGGKGGEELYDSSGNCLEQVRKKVDCELTKERKLFDVKHLNLRTAWRGNRWISVVRMSDWSLKVGLSYKYKQ